MTVYVDSHGSVTVTVAVPDTVVMVEDVVVVIVLVTQRWQTDSVVVVVTSVDPDWETGSGEEDSGSWEDK